MPTQKQVLRCFQICQKLTSMYLFIDLVRFDERTENIVIFAGQETLIEIYQSGNWRFIDET